MACPPASLPPRGRVLVVDDDPAIRKALAIVLDQRGLEVRLAPDGPTAVSLMRAERFHLLLVDFQLPGMTGLDLARTVGQTQAALPIALMTGHASPPLVAALAAVGITQLFLKPFDIEERLRWVADVFPDPMSEGRPYRTFEGGSQLLIDYPLYEEKKHQTDADSGFEVWAGGGVFWILRPSYAKGVHYEPIVSTDSG